MRDTRILMGMPITVEIVGAKNSTSVDAVFEYLNQVDARFSTYKDNSEISAFNRGEILPVNLSAEMKEVLRLSAITRDQSNGFFEIRKSDGKLDPSGIVKGWAINNGAKIIRSHGHDNFFIEAGGDVQSGGLNDEGCEWRIGIRSPFHSDEIIRIVTPRGQGMATSGTYVRGQHIYNPHSPGTMIQDIVSLSVIGPNILEADRFATAAFAMGEQGIYFIENLPGFEGYMVNAQGIATQTTGFGDLVLS
jgi:FAD:protein FMN transferase